MSYLSLPRPVCVDAALEMAQPIYQGHSVNGQPIMRHTVEVAKTYEDHDPNATATIFAGLLLHDTPDYTPNITSLEDEIIGRVDIGSLAVINAIAATHELMVTPPAKSPWQALFGRLASRQPDVLAGVVADELIGIRDVVDQATQAPNAHDYLAKRQLFVSLVPLFRAAHLIAEPVIAPPLATAFDHQVARAEHLITALNDLG